MGLPITQVDAFTDRPFAGNPAAVCVLPAPRSDEWMQQVAQEMNLSETAFLLPEAQGFRLRWFTPAVEVDLCGHATLASAHVLWEAQHLSPTATAQFYTRSGLLTARRQGEWIELDFPTQPISPIPAPDQLAAALGTTWTFVGQSPGKYLLVEVEQAAIVHQLQPNFALLQTLPVYGVIVTSRAEPDADFDFISRFFAPKMGIDEDPVTGSAHCCLGPYWQDKLHKTEFLAYQASPRGGVVRVRCAGDRVFLGGQAITVLRGELLDDAV